jgi:hypothetical protein
MHVLKTTGTIDQEGNLQLDIDIPTELPAGKVEVIVVLNPAPEKPRGQYDFSDLTSKLDLQGDPVAIQREMRDAW